MAPSLRTRRSSCSAGRFVARLTYHQGVVERRSKPIIRQYDDDDQMIQTVTTYSCYSSIVLQYSRFSKMRTLAFHKKKSFLSLI